MDKNICHSCARLDQKKHDPECPFSCSSANMSSTLRAGEILVSCEHWLQKDEDHETCSSCHWVLKSYIGAFFCGYNPNIIKTEERRPDCGKWAENNRKNTTIFYVEE